MAGILSPRQDPGIFIVPRQQFFRDLLQNFFIRLLPHIALVHIVPPKILCPPYYDTNDQKQQLSSKIPLKILCKTKKILAEIMKLYYNNNVR